MKFLGYILISIGLGLLIIFLYSLILNRGTVLSPLPDEHGVKVIYVTPGK